MDSGRHALRAKLLEVECNVHVNYRRFFKVTSFFVSCINISALLSSQLGYDIDGKELDDLFWRFKAVAERKKVSGNPWHFYR